MIAGSTLLVVFCLLCLLPARSNSGPSWRVIRPSCFVFLVTALAALRWIQGIRHETRKIQQTNSELSAQITRMIDDSNAARRGIEKKQLTDRATMLRVRHDLIGPIGSIAGFLQLLRDERYPLTQRHLAFIDNIDCSVGNLWRVIGGMEEETPPELLKKPAVSCQSIDSANERTARSWIESDTWTRGRR